VSKGVLMLRKAGTPRPRLPTTAGLFEGAFSFLIYLLSIKRKRAKNAQREEFSYVEPYAAGTAGQSQQER
jgi:hypothetical protein